MWDRLKEKAKTAFDIVKEAIRLFGDDRVNRMAAAVAYRALFALAPLLLIAIAILGIVVGDDIAARNDLLDVVRRAAGAPAAEAVENFLRSIAVSGGTASLTGFALLLWTSSSLFLELQTDLNDIFHVPQDARSGLVATIRKRGLGFLWALGLGLVMVAIWILNTSWQFLEGFFPTTFAPVHRVIGFVTPLVSLIVLPFVLALTFQVLSRVKVRWKAVWWGSFLTSFLFLVLSYGLSLYFHFSSTSPTSAAASIVVVIFLVYLLAAVFLLGAEVTKILNRRLEGAGDVPGAAEITEVVADRPAAPMPVAAVGGFLAGLLVAWRGRRR